MTTEERECRWTYGLPAPSRSPRLLARDRRALLDEVEARDRDLAEMRRQRDALKSATERLLGNFRLAIADKPVRDASETIAEAEAALTPKEPRDG